MIGARQLTFDEITGGSGTQRWRSRRSRFVPPENLFDPSRCEAVYLSESDAKEFVTTHHYSKSYPVARVRTGLIGRQPFGKERLLGAAVFSVPIQNKSIPKYLQIDPSEGVELGRLVLLDDPMAAFNAETWFIARSLKMLRKALPQMRGVISYSDPLPRFGETGEIIKPGHSGIVYRSSNSTFYGRSRGRTLIMTKRGEVVSERALSKIRGEESGIDYACRMLVAMGAPPRLPYEPGAGYVVRALAGDWCRKVPHPGNFVFGWTFK